MRPQLALLLLATLTIGCGGSGAGRPTLSPFFRVSARNTFDQSVSGGWDDSGHPVGVIFDDRNDLAQIRTAAGARSFSLKDRGIFFGLSVKDGFASFYSTLDDFDEVLLNIDTGAVYTATDAVVWTEGDKYLERVSDSDYRLGHFGGSSVVVTAPAKEEMVGVSGDFALLQKDEGDIPGIPVIDLGVPARGKKSPRKRVGGGTGENIHYYSFSRLSLSTGAVVEYAVPEGMVYTQVVSLNETGEAAGVAYPALNLDNPVLVRWSREGVPTVLATLSLAYAELEIANDGRLFCRGSEEEPMRIYDGGQVQDLNVSVPFGASFAVARDGRSVMLEDDEAGRISFYRTPPTR